MGKGNILIYHFKGLKKSEVKNIIANSGNIYLIPKWFSCFHRIFSVTFNSLSRLNKKLTFLSPESRVKVETLRLIINFYLYTECLNCLGKPDATQSEILISKGPELTTFAKRTIHWI